jgi:hypothetical protein
MILRAVFWIAVVAVFIPREPDVGFGRPNVPSIVPPKTAEWIAQTFKVPPCDERSQCLGGLSFASDLRQGLIERLERAKAEIREADRAAGVQHVASN